MLPVFIYCALTSVYAFLLVFMIAWIDATRCVYRWSFQIRVPLVPLLPPPPPPPPPPLLLLYICAAVFVVVIFCVLRPPPYLLLEVRFNPRWPNR